MTGTIKTITKNRAFGFIRGEDGADYFFHSSELRGPEFEHLREGQPVRFEPRQTDKGPRAAEVSSGSPG
jgi:cold shock CspA family protein